MKVCHQCGKCCTKYSDGGLVASADEIEGREIFKPDIYRYVSKGNIWFSPITGKQLSLCPWLEMDPHNQKYSCSIYYDRPDDCRHYPVTIELMEDSRPAVSEF